MARAEIIEPNAEPVEDTDNLLEETTQEVEQQQEYQEPELPDKYRGKSLQELAEMHQNAEKMIGKHSQEVGELRRIVDDFIRSQATSTPQASTYDTSNDEDDEVDFFIDPEKAVSKAIERHPVIQQANKYSQEMKQKTAQNQLQANHPDIKEILVDPKFQEWVQGSKIRTQLFLQADQQYDFDAANELLTTWKELKGFATQTANAEQKATKSAVKKAATGAARGSVEGVAKKKYRRSDIIKLMQTDPKRYEALQPEIMAAYAEGRVV